MEEIIPRVDRSLLLDELTKERFIRHTNFGKNEIYIIDHKNAPNVLREIGRLREVTFRDAGGGTGKSIDIDSYDLGEVPFQQLLVWNPDDQEIIGGYRFIHCKNLETGSDGRVKTPTSKLFSYSEKFIREYLPLTIELGRSFVQPEYQPARNIRKGLYALDNIWDGLGAIIQMYDFIYFFGKITMYTRSDLLAREAILYVIGKYFPDPEMLVRPHRPVLMKTDPKVFEEMFVGSGYDEDYRILQQFVRTRNEFIPPLVNTYMNLSSTMKSFGTSTNESFGDVEETGIMITVADIYNKKKERHLI